MARYTTQICTNYYISIKICINKHNAYKYDIVYSWYEIRFGWILEG